MSESPIRTATVPIESHLNRSDISSEIAIRIIYTAISNNNPKRNVECLFY